MVGPGDRKFVRYYNTDNSTWTVSSQELLGLSLKGGSLSKGLQVCVCSRGKARMAARSSSATMTSKHSQGCLWASVYLSRYFSALNIKTTVHTHKDVRALLVQKQTGRKYKRLNTSKCSTCCVATFQLSSNIRVKHWLFLRVENWFAYSCAFLLCFHQCLRFAARVLSVLSLPWDTLLVALVLDSPGWPEHSGMTTGRCRSEKVSRR